jgi:hypothetical protein
VAIQLDHHAWRSQARDDKRVFISEERSDVANQLIDCSRGLPQSPRLLRNDKQGEFICRSAATKQSIWLDRHALRMRGALLPATPARQQ